MIRAYAILFLCLFMLPLEVAAEAKNIRVIFLSRPNQTSSILPAPFKWVSRLLSQADDVKCQPFGDGCFHPQLGYIEDEKKVEKANTEKKLENLELKTINSEEVDLVNCDDDYYFDLYCGKAGKSKKGTTSNSRYQLWVDVSSSMRQVDFSTDPVFCERRRFVSNIQKECGEKLDVYTFNTGRQTMGSLDNVCLSSGTNNGSKLVQWLKSTDAENVLIITDVDEYNGEFREYLDLKNVDIQGIGVKPITAIELFGMTSQLKSVCL